MSRQVHRLALGRSYHPRGVRENRGLTRYPYTGWCLESVDRVRPAIGEVFGEHDREGLQLRLLDCDALYLASVAEEFKDAFPEAAFAVRDLEPRLERITRVPGHQMTAEEFYNFNATKRTVQLFTRNCQTPMFRWISRRDYDNYSGNAPVVPNEDLVCLPINTTTAAMNTAPCGMASHVYSDSKRIPGASDFVWGFHPHSFELDDVKAAVLWILGDNWELDVSKN